MYKTLYVNLRVEFNVNFNVLLGQFQLKWERKQFLLITHDYHSYHFGKNGKIKKRSIITNLLIDSGVQK